MNTIDKAIINRYHEMRVNEHGKGTIKALGWLDDNSQLLRFAMLAGIGDMNGRLVLDAGCGHGDLRAYLGEKYPNLQYAGLDQSEQFLAIAAKRYAHLPGTVFYLGDFFTSQLPAADYVLVSGSLNYRSSDPDFIYKMITKFYGACEVAFGFNLLNKINDPGGILVAYNIDDIMRHCRSLCNNLVLHDDYCDGDFTVWMYK
jgi:SAM-dependent methyltransferase